MPRGNLLKGPIAKATILTSVVLGVRFIVQAGTLLLVARMLGPAEFGAFAGVAALAVLMGTFSTFGTHLVLLGDVAKDRKQQKQVLSYAVPTTILSGSLLFIIYTLVCFFLLFEAVLPLFVVACIGLTEIVLLPLFLLPTIVQLALGKTASSQLLMILPLALRMLAAGAIILADLEYPLGVFACSYMLTALLALFLAGGYGHDSWMPAKQWRLATKQELKHSAGYAALALTAAGPSELDKMLAVKLMPLGVSGLYAAASRVVGAATLPVIALLLSAMPKLFRVSEINLLQRKRLMNWIFASVFLYGLVLAGLLWTIAPFVEWLFSVQYVGMAEMLKWLCLAVPGLALRIAAGSILITIDKPWLRATFEIVGMLIMVVVAIILYQRFEVKGMALALAASEWTMAVLGCWVISRCYHSK